MMFLLGDARSQNRAGGSGRLRSARFHADMARRQSLEQRHYLAAPAFLSCSGVLQGQTPYPFLFRQDFQNRAPFALSDALGSQLRGVAGLVGNEGGVVSGVINLESSGVEAPDWRPRHDEHYPET